MRDDWASLVRDRESVNFATADFARHTLLRSICACCGCNSRPAAVKVPSYNPAHFADSILERCDSDHDGSLTKQEANGAPGIAAQWSRYDANKDGAVSHDELAERVQKWIDRGDGLVSIMCSVRLGGQEIGDVQVKLVPDEALGGAVQAAETVSRTGRSSPLSIPPESKPEASGKVPGMQYGLYEVEVSHPTMKLAPAAGSSGIDIGPSDQNGVIKFNVERR